MQPTCSMKTESVNISFLIKGIRLNLQGQVGETLVNLKHRHEGLEAFECACEGAVACTTCHVIIDEAYYELSGQISQEEEDMLDLAFGRARTSRLGCQVKLSREFEGATFTVSTENRNFSPAKEME